jgi:hypothetical protein
LAAMKTETYSKTSLKNGLHCGMKVEKYETQKQRNAKKKKCAFNYVRKVFFYLHKWQISGKLFLEVCMYF